MPQTTQNLSFSLLRQKLQQVCRKAFLTLFGLMNLCSEKMVMFLFLPLKHRESIHQQKCQILVRYEHKVKLYFRSQSICKGRGENWLSLYYSLQILRLILFCFFFKSQSFKNRKTTHCYYAQMCLPSSKLEMCTSKQYFPHLVISQVLT